jgi:hypothetical protein
VDARIGLCATCRYSRTVAGARSVFYLCERSFSDPRFPRYPSLPVIKCEGYVAVPTPAADREETQ